MPLVFVYGSLKSCECNNDIMTGSKFVRPAITTPEYKLFDLGGYPGLIHADDGYCVHGEIWQVNEEKLQILDEFEGVYYHLYFRDFVKITGHSEPVYAYFWMKGVDRLNDHHENFGNFWHDGQVFPVTGNLKMIQEFWRESKSEKRCPFLDFDGEKCYCKVINSSSVCDTASLQLWCLDVERYELCTHYPKKGEEDGISTTDH